MRQKIVQPGSSPRMRGAPGLHASASGSSRIIPADAGSTIRLFEAFGQLKDHPRGCGEHVITVTGPMPDGGSSPRMRGALMISSASRLLSGIIPADAGSTRPAGPDPRGWLDHPRGCGEHLEQQGKVVHGDGSSPRMRGAHRTSPVGVSAPGIIPADAGSTPATSITSRACADHPRGCGEHRHDQRIGLFERGSSPRMRGAHVRSGFRLSESGIIPADAGSTRTRRRECWPTWDHPRGCGEHSRSNCAMTANMGSSPRMRGALFTVCR